MLREAIFAATLLATSAASAQAPPWSTPDVLTLRDGTRLEGHAEEVSLGVRVRFRTASGELREVPWAEIAAARGPRFDALAAPPRPSDGAAPTAPPAAPTHRPDPVADLRAQYLTAHPGAVAMRFETRGPRLELSVPVEPVIDATGAVLDEPPQDPYLGLGTTSFAPALPRPRTATLCQTPCTLYLAPGAVPLHIGAPGRLDAVESVLVPMQGQRVLLRSGSTAEAAAGFLLILLGGTLAVAGSIAVVAYSSGAMPSELFPAGVVSVVVGTAGLAAGIPLLTLTRTGVERMTPLRRDRARASPGRTHGAGVTPLASGGALLSGWIRF